MTTASIVLYNTDPAELAAAVASVVADRVDTLYVVDNSPTDALRAYAEGLSNKIVYLHGHGNVGYGTAHNLAIRAAATREARYHVVVNPDIYFEKGVIDRLAMYMDEHLDVGQVMPRVVYPTGELQYLCKLLPTPMDWIGRRFVPFRRWVARRNERFEMRATGYDRPMNVPYLSGCFMFLRMETLEATGGFDERFFMYCEDTDLCRRVGQAGWRTRYYPEVEIVHAHKKESYKSRAMLTAHIRSAIYYFNKWGWLFDRDRKKINRGPFFA